MQKFLGLCQNNSLHASSQRFLAVRNVNSVFSRVETVVYVIPNNSRVGRGGQWFHNGKRTSINVDPDGRNRMIINENGQRSSGYANSPYELEIPSLRIKGRVGEWRTAHLLEQWHNVDSATTRAWICFWAGSESGPWWTLVS